MGWGLKSCGDGALVKIIKSVAMRGFKNYPKLHDVFKDDSLRYTLRDTLVTEKHEHECTILQYHGSVQYFMNSNNELFMSDITSLTFIPSSLPTKDLCCLV